MTRKHLIGALLFVVALSFVLQSGGCKEDLPDRIEIELTRTQENAWMLADGKPDNSVCAAPKKQKTFFAKKVSLPLNCTSTERSLVKIHQNCIYKNLGYNALVSFGPFTTKNSKKSKSQLFNLTLDLSSPWSYVKSPSCSSCDRDGTNCKQDFCKINDNAQTYSCQNDQCKIISRCAEIDLKAEGMSIIGQFIETKLSFNSKDIVKG